MRNPITYLLFVLLLIAFYAVRKYSLNKAHDEFTKLKNRYTKEISVYHTRYNQIHAQDKNRDSNFHVIFGFPGTEFYPVEEDIKGDF